MREGDLVRFTKWEEVNVTSSKDWSTAPKNHIGTLIRHDKLMCTCEILYEGNIIKIRSQLVEKAGKKDLGFCKACECDPCDCGFGSY